jgi:hypothetical protein
VPAAPDDVQPDGRAPGRGRVGVGHRDVTVLGAGPDAGRPGQGREVDVPAA